MPTYAYTTDATWYAWTGASNCTATVTNVWGYWNATGTTTTTSYGQQVWTTWAGGTNYQPRQLTAEERAAQAERQAQWQREQVAAAAHRVEEQRRTEEEQRVARARAEELLLDNLTDEQQADYQETQSFRVISADGERVYRVKRGWSGNVELIRPDGRVAARYCIHPREWVPEQDNMLAQKLLLETDEQAFLRIANATRFAA